MSTDQTNQENEAGLTDYSTLGSIGNAYEFATSWYRTNNIAHSIKRSGNGGFGSGDEIPSDVDSHEFAEWLTEQYRLAMAKGIELARKEEKQPEIAMRNVMGSVGVFGALALLHDQFNKNPGQYETYTVIQSEIRRFDRELRISVEAVDPKIDREVSEALAVERRYEFNIVELADRDA